MIPLKYYAYLAAVLALAGLLWHDHYETHRANAAAAKANIAIASLETERKARAHEKEIADAASSQFQNTVTQLQGELAARPLKPVIIRVPVRAGVPAGDSAGTTSGSHEEAQGRESGTTEIDIAAELSNYALDCQINSLQLEALQGWVRSR